MRKTWIIAVAAAAVALAGCNREFDAPFGGDGVFRAAIETPTRVSFTDEGVFSWQEGDAIAVLTDAGIKTFTLQSGAGSASGTFTGDLVGATSASMAIYPAAFAKADNTVTLPAEYAWAEGQSNAVMCCNPVNLTGVNTFKHVGGILKITYAEIPADADALVLTAEAKITGDFTITDGVIAAGAGTDQVKVTFTAGSNPAAFYIPVPTGEYKFAVELQKAGAAIEGTSITTTNPIKVERKSLILMDPIQGVQASATIKEFAEEFVKILDVWQNTTGTIDQVKGENYEGGENLVENAHYVPLATTITVAGKTYTTADMWETAVRSYLLVRGYNGLDTENYGAGSIAAREGGAVAMSETDVPETHSYSWGGWPHNETAGNGGHLVKVVNGEEVHCQVDLAILDNFAMRALNYSHGQNISNMCTYPRNPITDYKGSFCAMRGLITYAFFFKYMLDNKLEKADAIEAETIIRSELFGDEGSWIPMEIATADEFIAFVARKNMYTAADEVKLTADITLPETFLPDTLWCNFDGQNHTVTYNLDIPSEATIPVGLFCIVDDGLTVKNLKTAGTVKTAKQNVGGIAGKAGKNVTFENCENGANLLGEQKQTYHMGGIAGDVAAGVVFRNCRNTGTVKIDIGTNTNTSQQGGIVGHIETSGIMENCVNDGEVLFNANGTARAGGMVGYINNVESMVFRNCVNNAAITMTGIPASGYAYAGGISGYFGTAKAGSEVLYDSCTNNGKIEAEEGTLQTRMGGIAAHGGLSTGTANTMTWTLTDCTNNGDIISAGTVTKNHLGGILGMVETSAKVVCDGCTNNAKVSVAGSGAAGGILGNTCGTESTFTNITVTAASVVEAKGNGGAGLFAGKPTNVSTAVTGKVGAATHIKKSTETVLTAENYQQFLCGSAMAASGTTVGVIFEEAAPVPVYNRQTDSLALVAIYNAAGGPVNWKEDRVWDLSKAMDGENKWYGVTLTDGRVTALKLLKATITADWTIPAEIANLTELTDLRFIDCKVNGNIPDAIYSLEKLQSLYLTNNKVTGTLSPKIGQLTALTNVYIDQNPNLGGSLPEEIGQLTNLVNLNISKTSFSGTIPESVKNLDALKNFMAYTTKFSGNAPDFWDELASLELVQLYDIPTLSGPLPASFGRCTKLKNIYMYSCNFEGNIPESWANLPTTMVNVRVQDNKLQGVVPAAVQSHAKWTAWKPDQYILPQQEGYGLTLQ